MADLMVNNLYWKNTKESVKDEYEVPPLVEDLQLVDFTGNLFYFSNTNLQFYRYRKKYPRRFAK